MNRIKEMNKRLDEREQEIERLKNIIEKLEQENELLKAGIMSKDRYSYGIRMGSDKSETKKN